MMNFLEFGLCSRIIKLARNFKKKLQELKLLKEARLVKLFTIINEDILIN